MLLAGLKLVTGIGLVIGIGLVTGIGLLDSLRLLAGLKLLADFELRIVLLQFFGTRDRGCAWFGHCRVLTSWYWHFVGLRSMREPFVVGRFHVCAQLDGILQCELLFNNTWDLRCVSAREEAECHQLQGTRKIASVYAMA